MIGAVCGGLIAQYSAGAMAFFIVGLPGVLVAIALKLIVKEPPRGHSETAGAPGAAEDVTPDEARRAGATLRSGDGLRVRELGIVGWRIFGTWSFLNMAAGRHPGLLRRLRRGAVLRALFHPHLRPRAGAWSGVLFGLIGGISSGAGTLLGGFVTDWANRRSAAWYALVPGIGLAIAMPIYIVAYHPHDWHIAAWILLLPGIFQYTYLGPTFGVIQNAVDTRRRATATALLFLFLNLIALGGGPPFTGWLIDQFAQFNFTHPGRHSILDALGRMFLHGEAAGGSSRTSAPAASRARAPPRPLTAGLQARPWCARTQQGPAGHLPVLRLGRAALLPGRRSPWPRT